MNKILWNSTKPPLRYFWVPAGEDVFAGEYPIENGDGEEASVELDSVIPFEISGEEAEAIMMAELEDMTSELGDLFKGLFSLGKRMINSELMDEDSEDWDSEDESDFDEDSSSDEDSDFEDGDLDKVISLFDDEDSDFEDSSDEGTLEDLLSQFGDDLEGPLNELRDLIAKEVGTLGQEFDTLGAEAASAIDAEPGAGQDILRELGQWLINLADEKTENTVNEDSDDDDMVVMEFRPKNTDGDTEDSTNVDSENDDDSEDSSEDSSEDNSDDSSEESSASENAIPVTTDEQNHPTNTDDSTTVDNTKKETTSTTEATLPSSAELKRMTKAQLVALGEQFGLAMKIKDLKQTLLEQLETLR